MATIIDNKITLQFSGDASSVNVDLCDDGETIFFEQDGDSLCVPRAEFDQFATIVTAWSAQHPRRSA